MIRYAAIILTVLAYTANAQDHTNYALKIEGGGIRVYGNSPDVTDVHTLKSSVIRATEVVGLEAEAITINSNKRAYGLAAYAHSTNEMQNYAAIGLYAYANSPNGNMAGYFNGDVTYDGTLHHISDQKFKENIRALPSALNAVLKLAPKEYEFIKSTRHQFPKGLQAGFLAQDVKKLIPNLVTENEMVLPVASDSIAENTSEKFLTMDYIGLIPYIIRSIQEQQEIIEAQDKAIALLVEGQSKNQSTQDVIASELPHIVNLFPNPASSVLEVEVSHSGKASKVEIFNKDGRVYYNHITENKILNISLNDFPNGVYLITLSLNGTTYDLKRFLVSK